MSRTPILLLLLALVSAPALAGETPEPWVTGKVGTLGIGAELTLPLSGSTSLRAGLSGFSHDFDESLAGNAYDLGLDLRTVSLQVDWRPWRNAFRVGAGVARNANELSATARVGETYSIGDRVYPATEVGRLSAGVGFGKLAPFLGVGWDTAVSGGKVGMSVEFGLLYQGRPKVSLEADGPGTNDPVFRAELEREQMDLQAELSSYRFYPVGSLGLSLRF